MKKRALLLAVAAATVTSAAFATPQTQWQEGQWQVDLGAWNTEASVNYDKLDGEGGDGTTNDKWNFTGGLTYGLNDKWAVQYNYYGLKTKGSSETDGLGTDGNAQEVNALYSINKNFAAYAGYNRIKNKFTSDDISESLTNNVAQIGIIGKAPLTDKLDVYGKAAIGTKNTIIWEAGLGYSITPDLDVSAGYRYVNTKFVDKGYYDAADDANISYKGFIAGLSYRFGADRDEAPAPQPAAPVYRPQPQPQAAPVVQQAPVRNDYYLESVHFGFDEDQPLSTEQSKLDHFVQVAKANPTHTFKLVGNTDSRGTDGYNNALSQRRVDNVAAYAQSQGVPASQLVLNYKGENDPVASNDSDQGRADNRRVDIWENK